MALIDNVKTSLGLFGTAVTPAELARDQDINDLIAACKEDLIQAGILPTIVFEDGPFVTQACKLYARAATDFQGKGEIYKARYEGYRDGYAMRQDYVSINS